MATTLEELHANLTLATTPRFRAQLLAKGQARAMIWRNGRLPPDAPEFVDDLSEDLLTFGYSLLSQSLRYLEYGGTEDLPRAALEVAAEALEAVVAKGAQDEERDFHRLVAAAAFHLGRFSARAYSLLQGSVANANLSPMEKCLAKLMLRDLDGLSSDVAAWFATGAGTDNAVIAALALDDAQGNEDGLPSIDSEGLLLALEGNFMAAVSEATLGLERGEAELIKRARERLKAGLEVAGELNEVMTWWCHRLTEHLLGGLWNDSFHNVLPQSGPQYQIAGEWSRLRSIYIASLYRRRKAEIELWPSQMQAARKVTSTRANLVLSLPTSAGKTRIAELCILACLAEGRRVIFVTPLRALSAQTEVSLRRTFMPLGKTVSSLYGSIGVHGSDIDTLSNRDIVVTTPEKLDFAIRSNPEILDDVGLVVLDEGHMIGLEERELRYEAQIQRLLRRPDAAQRRIICLSAILPDGEQLEDFSAWITGDKADGLIKDAWRPTRLRFGEVVWQGDHARLNISVGAETPFVPRFLERTLPLKGTGRKAFPSNQSELCLATAWRLVNDGQTVLVFCPLRVSVLPLAKCVIEMHRRGHIRSVLDQPESTLETALTIGAEWFGRDHAILCCLKLGVAVHHGALPSPYRKEVERLLREGTLKVTISSPTLAQGLNLAATCLVFHGLVRNMKLIPVAEFRNIVGRAGRAYIDLEGLVLYPMFDDLRKRRLGWNELITSEQSREMESGILRLLMTLLQRMLRKSGAKDATQLLDYVMGQGGWDFPEIAGENIRIAEEAYNNWPRYLMSLDTAIFSLLEDVEVPDDQIETKLDEVLTLSLFNRRVSRIDNDWKIVLPRALTERARYIWRNSTATQRRGYFLAGVGLSTGKALDEQSEKLESLLIQANVAIKFSDVESAINAIEAFAEIVFGIAPFSPKNLIDDWRIVLRNWLLGKPIQDASADNDDVIEFIEQNLVYRLPWAMEAVRVRAAAQEQKSDEFDLDAPLTLADFPKGEAVLALETGTTHIAAAILMQAGFPSRAAAIQAVLDTNAAFDSSAGMRRWMRSESVLAKTADRSWPTEDTHDLWLAFSSEAAELARQPWSTEEFSVPVTWNGVPPVPGTPLRLLQHTHGGCGVYDAEYLLLGVLPPQQKTKKAEGLSVATATTEVGRFNFRYIGPKIE